MTETIANLKRSGLLPHPMHGLRGSRGVAALALVLATALLLARIARPSSDLRALVACFAASVILLACAAILTQTRSAVPVEQVALGADALALFAVAMLAPALIVNGWEHSDITAAILVAVAGASVWVGHVATGEASIRLNTLTIGAIVSIVVCACVWILLATDSLAMREVAAGPIALAAVAPLFSAGAGSRQPAGITLGIAAAALVLVALRVMPDNELLLAIGGMVIVTSMVATRPRTAQIDPEIDLAVDHRLPWLPAATLVALAGLAVMLDGSWRWLAVGSFAIVAAGTIAAQGVDIVVRERLLVRLTRLNQHTARQARLDPLTRLPNRAALDARLNEEVERAIRYRHPAAVLFVDVDHFKSINDLQGHEAGDRALRDIGNTIRATIRTPDFVARFGGEEFVIIAPGTWSVDATVLGRRIQAAIGEAIHHADGRPVTVSVGIAGVPEHGTSPDEVLRIADEALYRAKRTGRDRVEIAILPEDQHLLDNS